MSSRLRNSVRLAGLGAVLLVWATHVLAQGEGSVATKELDQKIYESLRDVINQGADLYNLQGDAMSCYRIYQGGLLAVRPLLGHHPELRKLIDKTLAQSERMPRIVDRAFALNKLLGDIRDKLDPQPKKVVAKNLWERLGGEANVRRVIDDFVAMAANDPKVDFTRGGKHPIDEAGVKRIKQLLLELISQESGGPYKYSGKSMKEAHRGMGITDAQFNAAAEHLRHALAKNKAAPADIDLLLKAIGTTRSDVVESKNSKVDEGKKPQKKPPEKLVIGTILWKGQPLQSGFVTFIAVDGRKYSASIQQDGTFGLTALAPGKYRIIFEPSVVPVLDQNGQFVKSPPAPGPQVAGKYLDPATTPLAIEIRAGRNQFDIRLD